MKLAIVNLTSGGMSGGYRKYLKKLLPLLQKHPSVQSIKIYLPPLVEASFDQEITENLFYWPADDWKRDFRLLKQI